MHTVPQGTLYMFASTSVTSAAPTQCGEICTTVSAALLSESALPGVSVRYGPDMLEAGGAQEGNMSFHWN